jgi:hypothetical protein
MNKLLVLMVVAAGLGPLALECLAQTRAREGRPSPRPFVVAQSTSPDERKLATIAETEGEARTLSLELERVARITPTDGGANPAFAQAKKAFDEKLGLLGKKLDALRAAPADAAQEATHEVNAALQAVRTAYSQALAAAP